MKLFKRNKGDSIDHNGTYNMDSDDDSIPPPPPPLPPMDSTTVNNDHTSVVSSVKTSNEEFEHSPFVTEDPMEQNGVAQTSPRRGGKGYSQVPLTGYFRGMRKAQSFDEEEAGMDEIEVPSSSVVERFNQLEKKYALRKKCKIIALITFAVVLGIVAVSLGTVFGTKSAIDANQDGTGDNDNDAATHMDTPAGRFILSNEALPASTKEALQQQDENSAAYKAFVWIESADVNQNFNFNDETALNDEATKLELIQRFSLATMANSFNGNDVEGWMTEDSVCNWEGVVCGTQADIEARKLQEGDAVTAAKITTLSLSGKALTGSIAPEISLLQNLVEFEMFGNSLSDEIPDELYSLTNLEILDLYDNQLSGSISTKIGNMKNLIGLYLGRNDFTGAIPVEIFDIDSLVAIWLDDCQFEPNPLPAEIGQLVNLEQLRLSGSNMNGSLPEEIGQLVKLNELTLARNGFEETIPDISGLVNLEILDLSNNWFSGNLPRLRDSIQLKYLSLNGNVLGGRIPNHYGILENLVELRLGPNTYQGFPDAGLTEQIPDSLGSLLNLEVLELQGNMLSGEIPVSLSDLASLERLLIQNNADIQGAVPIGLCELDPVALEVPCHVQCACCTDADSCDRN